MSGVVVAHGNDGGQQPKHNICHATSSESNPWEAISIADNNHSHDGHVRDYPYNGPVKDNGQPTKDGDKWCEENAPKPPVDICPNIDGLQLVLPEGKELRDGLCIDKTTPPTTVNPNLQPIDEPLPTNFKGK